MIKVMLIFGTRPEAIKLAPIVQKLKAHDSHFKIVVCVTAQHREMLDQVLDFFQIVADYDLDIMTEGQDLFEVTTRALAGLGHVLRQQKPDLVLVQGDTTTSFVGSLAAYYLQIPVGHVEAGLRTYNKYNPFPEEKNRHLIGVLADYHFAPTEWAKSNLLRENVPENRIWVTGNTVIDALLTVVKKQKEKGEIRYLNEYFLNKWGLRVSENDRKLILVTGHRRESFGEDFKNICLALREIAEDHRELDLVYPVHLNPNVQKPVRHILGPLQDGRIGINRNVGKRNIFLIKPLDYAPFVFLMGKAHMILTDSGGIQEEAPSLGRPVLVMRNRTERPEGIEVGTAKLVGTNKDKIVREVQHLLDNKEVYERMSKAINPYGDGKAAERIVRILHGEV
jgi:UDP-N-acetylglucosamine 2-epimerase (non-hydrolysing)